MLIGAFKFEHVCEIAPERDANGNVRRCAPQAAFRNERNLPLNRYGSGPFCKFRIPTSFNVGGVYAIQINDEVSYIGECVNLSARYNAGYGNISPRNCFRGGQETNCRLNNLIFLAAENGARVHLWFHKTPDYKTTELEILSIKQWQWNRR